MTLIVGRTRNGKVALAADTLITEGGRPLLLANHVMKTCVFPFGLCVGFSNSPDLAKRDLWKFMVQFPNGADFGDTTSYFEQSSRSTGNEYLLAFADTGRLVKIRNGRRQESLSHTQWIGDKDAYEAFREYEGRARRGMEDRRALTSLLNWGDNDNGIGGQLFNALKQVIHSKNFPAVGGLVTLVNNGNGAGFQTPALTDMLYDWPYPMSYEGEVDLNASINLRVSGENDLQSTNLFGSAYPGLSLLGYYFLAGKLAVLFVPHETQLADHVVILRNVEPDELIVRMKEQLGFDYLWQLGIASPQRADMSRAEGEEGIALAFYVHANTFPKTGEKIVGKPLKLRFPGVPLV